MNNMLLDSENRKVSKIEFFTPLIDNNRSVKYDCIKLKSDKDLKVIRRTYHRRLTKRPIEFEVIITISINDIINILKPLESSGSVWVFLFIFVLLCYVI